MWWRYFFEDFFGEGGIRYGNLPQRHKAMQFGNSLSPLRQPPKGGWAQGWSDIKYNCDLYSFVFFVRQRS